MTGARRAGGAVVSVGVAAPSLRLPAAEVASGWGRAGGRGQVAVCAADEDPLTLAWTAAVRAMAAAGLEPLDVEGLWWGCARPPFAEGPSVTHLAAALRLGAGSDGALCSGSPHAGIDALLAAADAVASGRVGTALAVASDALLPALGSGFETSCGAGASAVVLRAEGPARLGTVVSRWRPVLDRYRGDSEGATREVYDARLFREQVFVPLCAEVVEAVGTVAFEFAGTRPSRWSLPDPDGRLGAALARRVDVGELVSAASRMELGDTGSAAALAGAAAALAEPGALGLLAYGGGRATAVVVEVDAAVPGAECTAEDLSKGEPTTYTAALRARGALRPQGEVVEMAVPPGSAMFVRGSSEMLGLLGARCLACGTVNTPPSIHPACPACGGTSFDDVTLPRTGNVQTYVVNRTMPAPFVAPLPLVVVDLDDGSRLMTQGVGDGSDLAVGTPVELVLRRYTVERGVPVYGYKAAVTAAGEPADGQVTQRTEVAT